MSGRHPRVAQLLPTEFYQAIRGDQYTASVVGVLFSWGVLDTVTTFVAIRAYGTIQYELNPVSAWLLSVHPSVFVVGKIISLTAVGMIALVGREFIEEVYGWKLFFNGAAWIGVLIALLNLYAAMTEFTGYNPLF